MSIRYFCDLCKKELDQNDSLESSSFKYYEKSLSFFKHQKQEGTKEITLLLCKTCTKKVKKTIDQIGIENNMEDDMEITEIKQ